MCNNMYYLTKPDYVFTRELSTMEFSLMARVKCFVCSYVEYLDWRDKILLSIFDGERNIKRRWIGAHLGM